MSLTGRRYDYDVGDSYRRGIAVSAKHLRHFLDELQWIRRGGAGAPDCATRITRAIKALAVLGEEHHGECVRHDIYSENPCNCGLARRQQEAQRTLDSIAPLRSRHPAKGSDR